MSPPPTSPFSREFGARILSLLASLDGDSPHSRMLLQHHLLTASGIAVASGLANGDLLVDILAAVEHGRRSMGSYLWTPSIPAWAREDEADSHTHQQPTEAIEGILDLGFASDPLARLGPMSPLGRGATTYLHDVILRYHQADLSPVEVARDMPALGSILRHHKGHNLIARLLATGSVRVAEQLAGEAMAIPHSGREMVSPPKRTAGLQQLLQMAWLTAEILPGPPPQSMADDVDGDWVAHGVRSLLLLRPIEAPRVAWHDAVRGDGTIDARPLKDAPLPASGHLLLGPMAVLTHPTLIEGVTRLANGLDDAPRSPT